MTGIIQIITAMLGTLGFAVVFRSKKEHLIVLAVGGAVSWAAYLTATLFSASEPVCYYIAAAAVGIYSEIFARVLKTPATNILIPSVLPLIPGGGLYYTMRLGMAREWQSFFERGSLTFAIALAIALGIITVSTVVKLAFRKKGH